MVMRCSFVSQSAAIPSNVGEWRLQEPLVRRLTTGVCTDSKALHPCVIPTRHLQRSLFRLPVPQLKKTCRHYLDAVRPLVSPKQYSATMKIVEGFQAREGVLLQRELQRTDSVNKHTSYICADWSDRYLMDRTPLPINRNFCFITRRDVDKPDMLTRAAFWITSSVNFQRMYLNDTLRPDFMYVGSENHYCRKDWFHRTVALTPEYFSAKVAAIGSGFHAIPLDMSRYDYLMCSTRVPGVLRDEIRAFRTATHIIVLYRGQQYVVTVADKDCQPLPEAQVYARLRAITEMNPAPPVEDVGIFTTMDRTSWNAVRADMMRHHVNQSNLELIDSALFIVSLDDDLTVDYLQDGGASAATRWMLSRGFNRWWDKSFGIIVSKDGVVGVNVEQSWGGSAAVKRYMEDAFNYSVMRSSKEMDRNAAPTEPVRQLLWRLTPDLQQRAARAKLRMDEDVRRFDVYTSLFPNVGYDDALLRGLHILPDELIQIAIQLAWWRLNKSTVSTCECRSTTAYLRGCTDCVRSATEESQGFTMLMGSSSASVIEKRNALISAVKRHKVNTKTVDTGYGIDCHLFALRMVAERRDPQHLPLLFLDPSYRTLCSNVLTTSSLSSNAVMGGGFGSVDEGYGVAYIVDSGCVVFNVSCWKGVGPVHSAADFSQAVCAAFADSYRLLEMNGNGK